MLTRGRTWVVLLAIALVLLAAGSGDARHRVHGGVHIGVGVGPVWWGAPYPYWPYAYYPYWGPYWYWPPPVVVRQEPPVYIQQPEPPPPPETYWYYCPSARGYYPTVPQCPEPWVKVAPRP